MGTLSRCSSVASIWADTYSSPGSTYCESRTPRSLADQRSRSLAALSLEEGRSTEARDAATASSRIRETRPGPITQALDDPGTRARATRRSGCSRRTRRVASVDIPPDDVETHVDRAAAHAEIAWLERRLDAIDAATVDVSRPWSRGRCAGRRSARVLATARRPHDRVAARPAVIPSRSASQERGRRRPRSGHDAVSLTRLRSRSRRRATSDRFDRPTTIFSGSAHSRPPGSCPNGSGRSEFEVSSRDRGLRHGRAPAGLTTREVDVLALLADGLRNAQIAERLVVSRRTVDHHVSAILRKLEAATRGEAVARAGELGLLAA